jgi:DNA polymerase III subunit delta
LVDQQLSSLVETLSAQAGDALAVEDLPLEIDLRSIVDVCQTPSLLGDRRIVVVRNAGRFKAADVEPLIDCLRQPMDSTFLVLTSGGGALPTKLTKSIKDHGKVIDASTPFGKGRQGWIADKVRKGPVSLDGQALSFLTEHLGEELGQLEGVLDALAAAYGEGARVSLDELRPFLGPGGSSTPWELTDAIDSGNTDVALAQLERMLGPGGRHPLVVTSILSKHIGQLMRLDGAGVSSEAEAASLLGISAFPAKKALAQSQRLGSNGVAKAVQLISEADVDLRGGSAWPQNVVLEVLVARLSRLRGRAPTPGRQKRS